MSVLVMSVALRRLRSPIALALLTLVLLLIFASSAIPPFYRHLNQANGIQGDVEDMVLDHSNVASFYRGRTARWKETVRRTIPLLHRSHHGY
jgi:hypothetical protein